MIKKFVEAWDKNKHLLEERFRTNTQDKYCNYKILVKLIFDEVINPASDGFDSEYDTSRITEIDDGSYQGTLVYLIPANYYQPDVNDYVYTYVEYGSCSVCDTLQGIHGDNYDAYPDETQIKAYMTLCLHILQSCAYLRPREEDKEVTK